MKPLLPDFAVSPAAWGQHRQIWPIPGHVNVLHTWANHYTAVVDCKRLMGVPWL